MPSGMAAQVRELLATSDKTGLVLQRAPPGSSSKTGFVNVIQVKGGLFQARLQVQGDGRGGEKKRRSTRKKSKVEKNADMFYPRGSAQGGQELD